MEIRRIFTDAMLVNLIAAIGMLVFVPLFDMIFALMGY